MDPVVENWNFTQHQIKEVYLNPKTGFRTAKDIYKQLGKKIKIKDIKAYLDTQSTHQITKQPRRIYHKIIGPPNTYQADILFLPYPKHNNKGFTSVLLLIELTSRKVFGHPLKHKTKEEVLNAFQTIQNDIPNP